MTRRNQVNIFCDILSVVKEEPIELTNLLYKINMSYTQLKFYVKLLEAGKFILIRSRLIDITEDGIKLFELLSRLIGKGV